MLSINCVSRGFWRDTHFLVWVRAHTVCRYQCRLIIGSGNSGSNLYRSHEALLFTGFFLLVCSACCLIYSGPLAHSNLGAPTSISNQEDESQDCPQANLVRVVSQTRFPLLSDSILCQVDIKLVSTVLSVTIIS